jgi:GxxExxY protein
MQEKQRRDPRTHELIGAGFEVHRVVGPGFGEAVCRDAYAVELQLRGIPFQTEVPFRVVYKDHKLPSFYRADLVCYDSVIVEIKSLSVRTGAVEQAQMLRYLRSSQKELALLLNFGLPSLEYRRFVSTHGHALTCGEVKKGAPPADDHW